MSDAVDGLVTLQERMVNLIKQLNMPIIEVSMVIQNMLSPMLIHNQSCCRNWHDTAR